MDRRRFLVTSFAGALVRPLAAEAQPAGKLVRIGILHSGSLPDANIEALRSGLRQRDYVEAGTSSSSTG